MSSPYYLGNVVTEKQMFFGRTDELGILTDAVRNGSSKSVVGLRRIGKSSLLYYLTHFSELSERIAITYLNAQDSRYHTVAGLLQGMLTRLSKATNQRYGLLTQVTMNGFADTVERMKRDGYQPVICLDELERLMMHPEIFDKPFFESLRALGNMGTIAFITASRLPIAEIVKHNNETSPFTNIFTQLTLAGLSPNSAHRMLTQPFTRDLARTEPPPNHIEPVMPYTGHHPYLLSVAGDVLWRYGGINKMQFFGKLAAAARQPLQQLWHDLSPVEQAAATRLATGQGAVPNWESHQQHLLEMGLAEKNNQGELRLFSKFLIEWIQDESLLPANHKPAPQAQQLPQFTPSQNQATPTVYAYLLVALVTAGFSLLIALLLPVENVLLFFAIFTVILLFVLVGVNKITGGQFLEWLHKLLNRL